VSSSLAVQQAGATAQIDSSTAASADASPASGAGVTSNTATAANLAAPGGSANGTLQFNAKAAAK
jgi:hypothetical protein